MQTTETWLSLESQGFDNYMVSSRGRVMNVTTRYILSGSKNNSGYVRVQLEYYQWTYS